MGHERVQVKPVGDFFGAHCIAQILLVGENEHRRILKRQHVDHLEEFVPRHPHAISVAGVDNKDERLRILGVKPPERPNLVLSAQIPANEGDAPVPAMPWRDSVSNYLCGRWVGAGANGGMCVSL
jgi:hypothetical protein